MPIKITVLAPGNVQLELTCENQQEVFQQLAFWTKLPHTCPIDGYPTVLDFKSPQGNDYYSITSTGPIPWSAHVGQKKEDKSLYYANNGVWSYWDAEQKREVQRKAPHEGGGADEPSPKAEVAESATDTPPWDDNNDDPWVERSDVPPDIEIEGVPDELEYGSDGWPNVTNEEDSFLAAIVGKARAMGVTFNQVVNSDVGQKLPIRQASELYKNADIDMMRDFYKATVVIGKRAAEAAAKKT